MGPKVIGTIAKAAAPALTHHIARLLTPPTVATVSWASPCSLVTPAEVAAAVGRPVYSVGPPADDVCQWTYIPRTTAYLPVDVVLATGWTARSSTTPNPSTATYSQDTTSVAITVPQFAAVPDAAVRPGEITQPINVRVTTRRTTLTPAAAKHAATVLAQDLARHMPTGPGSTIVRSR